MSKHIKLQYTSFYQKMICTDLHVSINYSEINYIIQRLECKTR